MPKDTNSNYKRFFMRSGGCLDFSRDRIDFLPLDDILHSLAYERRFFNQIDWSVLQHSIACGFAAEQLYGLNTLLVKHTWIHDFTEAFLRDVPAVVKIDGYKEVEYDIQNKLFAFMGIHALSSEDYTYLKTIDLHMRLVEAFHLYQSSEAFDAMVVEQEHIDPAAMIACCHGFQLAQQVKVLLDNGELNPAVTELFREVLAKY
jgi:hypothetical protein